MRNQVQSPTSMSSNSADPSRRRFLVSAAGVALGVPLLAACAPQALTPTATRPATVATTSGATGKALYPTYQAATGGPKPDFPASGPMYDDAFNSYPATPVKALPADPPGTGSTVNIMSIQLFPPPTVYDQNPAWQAVNKALNATVKYEIVTSADYPVKLGTVMAGNDLPDLLYMYTRPGASEHACRGGGSTPVLADAGRRPDTIPRRRRGQGLSESGGNPDAGVEERGLRVPGSSVHDPDPPLPALVHVAQERERLRQGVRRRLRTEKRRRLQAHTPDPDAAKRRLLRDLGRTADHHVAAAVQPAFRRAQRLAAGGGREAHQRLGNAGVQRNARLGARPVECGSLPSQFHVVCEWRCGAAAIRRRQVWHLARSRQWLAGRLASGAAVGCPPSTCT